MNIRSANIFFRPISAAVVLTFRNFSTNLKWIEHSFDIKSAENRFTRAEDDSLLGRFEFEKRLSHVIDRYRGLSNHGAIPSSGSAIQQCLSPFYGVNATVERLFYQAQYGVQTSETYNLNGKTEIRTKTVWFNTSGDLEPIEYNPDSRKMRIYAGLDYTSTLMEEAHAPHPILDRLKNFHKGDNGTDNILTPFKKSILAAENEAFIRIRTLQIERARVDVLKKHGCDLVVITHLKPQMSVGLSKIYLPAYILTRKHVHAPLILSSISAESAVAGHVQQSPVKLSLLGFAASVMVSAVQAPTPPQVKIAMLISGAAFGALWGAYGRDIINKWNEAKLFLENNRLNEQKNTMDEFDYKYSPEEDSKQKDTKIPPNKSKVLKGVSKEYFSILGLKHDQALSKEQINTAFREKIKICHSDHSTSSNSNQLSQKVIEARNELLKAFGN